ncbi:nucleoside 2-deoxyribosyltransferase [Bifidobacterium canis]|uniref:Nucleoside 2-deoxyribosyltransferase n=1 Tax=Bifidobacterium canis TaxID=2610880 RepID=A0A7K1J351_9BIFI|nr:nucleoside 2-deoxyribosyltransferase [Bifidobacterium canis]MUH58980.1 nucleoside 2-deoxyribosyltransferase [Bifidobacterium canis]
MENLETNNTITFTSSKPIYDFYVAGPYETAEQVESMERLERVLHDRNMSMYRPRFAMDVNVSGPEAVFEHRIEALKNSRAVIANFDDKDEGTIFTMGYAYALGKPVYAYCEGILPNARISLMIDQAATAVLDGPSALAELLDSGRVKPLNLEQH